MSTRDTRCRFVVSLLPEGTGASIGIEHEVGGTHILGTLPTVDDALAMARESYVNRGLPVPDFNPGLDAKLDAVAPWMEFDRKASQWRLA